VQQVHGNASVECTAVNAARCLRAFGAPESVKVYPGAVRPLIRPARHDPELHGKDGLGGVVGLPTADDPEVLGAFAKNVDGEVVRALDGISKYVREIRGRGEKVSIISCGPMTNIALFVSVYPDLLDGIEQFVFMGGGVGIGNRSAVAGKYLCLPTPIEH
jgi:uridine nucleosidase